jgi:hypothetical protein
MNGPAPLFVLELLFFVGGDDPRILKMREEELVPLIVIAELRLQIRYHRFGQICSPANIAYRKAHIQQLPGCFYFVPLDALLSALLDPLLNALLDALLDTSFDPLLEALFDPLRYKFLLVFLYFRLKHGFRLRDSAYLPKYRVSGFLVYFVQGHL